MKKIILITLLSIFLTGCANLSAPDVSISNHHPNTTFKTNSTNTINGFFPTLDLRDVLFQAGVLFTRPSSGVSFLGNEEVDNIVCTNNVSLLLTNFELKSTGTLFSFDIFESPNVSSLGIEIMNPVLNVNRQSSIISNLTFYILPTIIDDGILIFSDTGIGSNQVTAKTTEFFQDFLLKKETCYNFRVINEVNQVENIFSQFEAGEIPENLSSPQYGINLRSIFE